MRNFRVKQNFPFQLFLSRDVENAYFAYETSAETGNLESEENRKIHCELIDFDWGRDWNKKYEREASKTSAREVERTTIVSIRDDDDGGSKETARVKSSSWWNKIKVSREQNPNRLQSIALKAFSKSFAGGSLDGKVLCQDQKEVASVADVDLPLSESLLEFDNEIYWKRVVTAKIKDLPLLEKLLRSKCVDWKRIGVELICAEFCENLRPSEQNYSSTRGEIEKLTKLCSPVVKALKIRNLRPETRDTKNEFNPDIKTINYKNEECSHISLAFLKDFADIEKLSVSFKPESLGFNYERRFFKVSAQDIRNLSAALENFSKLHTLEVTETDLGDSEKMSALLSSIENLPFLKSLSLTHCNISAGLPFEYLFSKSSSIEYIELKHNNLNYDFCLDFASGIRKFQSRLKYLGLSMCGVFHNGLDLIIGAILLKDNVESLDISCCEGPIIDQNSTVIEKLACLLRSSRNLHKLDMKSNKIKSMTKRQQIIEALKSNFKVEMLDCFNCDFTANEEVKIKVLLLRNEFYRANPILKKESFSREDEVEIENWLRIGRSKHALLLKHDMKFFPTENVLKWENKAATNLWEELIENFENYVIVEK